MGRHHRKESTDEYSQKFTCCTIEKVMHDLKGEDSGMKTDEGHLHFLRFGTDIVIITPSTIKRNECWAASIIYVRAQLNLSKTVFVRNGRVSDATFKLNGAYVSDAPDSVFGGQHGQRSSNRKGRRKRTAWRAV